METVPLGISQKRSFLSSCEECADGPGVISWLSYASNFRDDRAKKTYRDISSLGQNLLMCPYVTGNTRKDG